MDSTLAIGSRLRQTCPTADSANDALGLLWPCCIVGNDTLLCALPRLVPGGIEDALDILCSFGKVGPQVGRAEKRKC